MAEKEKKKRVHRKYGYLNEFQVNDAGEYEFRGITYVYDGKRKSWETFLKEVWISEGLLAALLVISGCIPASGMRNTFYVLVPWAVCICLVANVLYMTGRITSSKGQIRDYKYKKTIERIPDVLFVLTVFLIMTIIGQLFQALFGGMGDRGLWTLIYEACLMLCIPLCVTLRRRVLEAVWKK